MWPAPSVPSCRPCTLRADVRVKWNLYGHAECGPRLLLGQLTEQQRLAAAADVHPGLGGRVCRFDVCRIWLVRVRLGGRGRFRARGSTAGGTQAVQPQASGTSTFLRLDLPLQALRDLEFRDKLGRGAGEAPEGNATGRVDT